jgi:hypothetical protein
MRKLRLAGALMTVPLLALALIACGGTSADEKQSVAATVEASVTPVSTATVVASTPTPASTDVLGSATPTAAAATPTAEVSAPTPTFANRQTPGATQATSTLAPATPTLAPGTKAVAAPIDGLEVRTLESSPPRYAVNIKAGLPSGCAKRYTNSIERNGNNFRVTVLNALPTGQAVCTMIYGLYELNLTLPGTFVSGQMYTVEVNDKKTTFRAH